MLQEFKKFIARGSVLDLAVGVIVGGAFTNIVTSLVNNIFTPLIGIILGGLDFSSLSISIGDEQIMYGAFIESVFDFLLIALCIFLIVKFINRISSDLHKNKKDSIKEVKKSEDILLLEEIRDLLKSKK